MSDRTATRIRRRVAQRAGCVQGPRADRPAPFGGVARESVVDRGRRARRCTRRCASRPGTPAGTTVDRPGPQRLEAPGPRPSSSSCDRRRASRRRGRRPGRRSGSPSSTSSASDATARAVTARPRLPVARVAGERLRPRRLGGDAAARARSPRRPCAGTGPSWPPSRRAAPAPRPRASASGRPGKPPPEPMSSSAGDAARRRGAGRPRASRARGGARPRPDRGSRSG